MTIPTWLLPVYVGCLLLHGHLLPLLPLYATFSLSLMSDKSVLSNLAPLPGLSDTALTHVTITSSQFWGPPGFLLQPHVTGNGVSTTSLLVTAIRWRPVPCVLAMLLLVATLCHPYYKSLAPSPTLLVMLLTTTSVMIATMD